MGREQFRPFAIQAGFDVQGLPAMGSISRDGPAPSHLWWRRIVTRLQGPFSRQ
jgi:hypothetical protein